ncbi:MAG: family 16 glycoside hydrolase [Cyclobacteriaceae bacterium]
MRLYNYPLLIFICLFCTLNGFAQSIPFDDTLWAYAEGTEHQVETIDGQKTLMLNGRAEVRGQHFTDGSIEVDVFARPERSFGGISFRKQDDTMEEVYLRLHKSGQADAIQYTPIYNGESNWQLYREHQAAYRYQVGEWHRLMIKVSGHTATVYVDNKEVLQIDQLRTSHTEGGIGLFALFGARFANFRVVHQEPAVAEIPSLSDMPEGLVTRWKVSQSMPYGKGVKVPQDTAGYQVYATEASGLLPISKYIVKSSGGDFEGNGEDYVVVRLDIRADGPLDKAFTFDYSDRVIVFLNGRKLYEGNNAFRQKGVQYMGHLAPDTHKLYLPLKEGSNVLECLIIERANGWGLTGRFPDTEGIELIY